MTGTWLDVPDRSPLKRLGTPCLTRILLLHPSPFKSKPSMYQLSVQFVGYEMYQVAMVSGLGCN